MNFVQQACELIKTEECTDEGKNDATRCFNYAITIAKELLYESSLAKLSLNQGSADDLTAH